MKKNYRLIEKITNILLILSAVIVLTIGFQTITNGYVTVGGYSMFRVVTGSMEPTIKTGSLLICDDTDISKIRINDIVCFKSGLQVIKNQVVTHRVIDINVVNGNIRLKTRGDANSVEDALDVSNNNLIGRVIWYSQEGNFVARVISFMNGEIGFLSCIVIPVLIICGMTLHHSMMSIQKDITELRKLELQKQQKKKSEKTSIYDDLHIETEEELRARLRAEIRKELGLEDE